MSKILNSKSVAWGVFLIVLILMVCTFKLRVEWWMFFDIFFAFMMIFCHVIALVIEKYNKFATAKLERIAVVMGILTVFSFIGEWIAWRVIL